MGAPARIATSHPSNDVLHSHVLNFVIYQEGDCISSSPKKPKDRFASATNEVWDEVSMLSLELLSILLPDSVN